MKNLLTFLGFVVLVFCAPALGAFSQPGEWYDGLVKPSWNPPGWLFGPVWTALYLMIATSGWLVWRKGGLRENRAGLGAWLGQLVLNAAWTPLFFGMQAMGAAFVEIVCMWAAILLTIVLFWRGGHRAAALLLTPYLGWVSFATVLNFTLWRLNA